MHDFIKMLFFALFFIACSKVDENTILLSGIDKFNINPETEENIDISKNVFAEYELIIRDNIQVNLPLHKVIQGNKYQIFVALPLNITNEDLIKSVFGSDYEKSHTKSVVRNKDSFVYSSLVGDSNSDRKYLVSIIGSDSIQISNFYKTDDAKSRIVFNK